MTMSMDQGALATIARAFGEEPEAEAVKEGDRIVIRTDAWDWTLEPVPPGPPLTDAFRGTLYQAVPEVFIEGGGGLRARWFAVAEGQVFTLDQPVDMRRFLERYVSRNDPLALASFVERCVGDGRVANVYRTDGGLESMLDEDGRLAILEIGLEPPAMEDDELRFWTWRVVMHEGEEVIQLERWTVSFRSPDGAEWQSSRLPGLLHFG
jgi:hypothetical protein